MKLAQAAKAQKGQMGVGSPTKSSGSEEADKPSPRGLMSAPCVT